MAAYKNLMLLLEGVLDLLVAQLPKIKETQTSFINSA